MDHPWQFSTWLDLVDHWQSLLAGLMGFSAAIFVVCLTLLSERRRAERELAALKRSLGVEVRQCVSVALGSHRLLATLAQKQDGPITSIMVRAYLYIPEPIIFRSCADKVGLLESEAMNVAIVYGLLETIRSGADRVANSRTPDDISPSVVASLAKGLLTMCQHGVRLLPTLPTQVAEIDKKDHQVAISIDEASAHWQALEANRPDLAATAEHAKARK